MSARFFAFPRLDWSGSRQNLSFARGMARRAVRAGPRRQWVILRFSYEPKIADGDFA